MSPTTSAPAVSRATPRTRANRARASPSPRASTSRAMDIVSTTLIVDDLVFHDGSTVMERLGGGGPQTLFGALCHRDGASARVGIVAGVGEDDCPESSRRWLVERGVDVDGLLAVSGGVGRQRRGKSRRETVVERRCGARRRARGCTRC